MIRLGLIGAGPWAHRYVETAKLLPGVSFPYYARQKIEDVPWLPYAKRITPKEMLTSGGDIDGLVIACEPAAASDYALQALDAGIPALIEKPLTRSVRAAFEIMARATAAHSWIRVGYTHLHAPAYKKLSQMLQDHCRKKGDTIANFSSVGHGMGPFRSYSSLWDYGPHDAAIMFDLAQTVGELSSFKLLSTERTLIDQGQWWIFDLTLGEGIAAKISVSNDSDQKVRKLHVITQKGHNFIYDDKLVLENKLIVDGTPVPIDGKGALTQMLEDFVTEIARSIRSRTPPPDHLHELNLTTKITELLTCVERSVDAS